MKRMSGSLARTAAGATARLEKLKKNPSLLVLGGTGFIGRHIIKKAVSKRWYVTSVSLSFPDKNKRIKKVQYYKVDLKNFSAVKNQLNKSFNYVIYFFLMYCGWDSFWCLLNTKSYLESVFKAINLGEDTDTTATVVGGVSGLYYGLNDVPEGWLKNLARVDDIKKLAEDFSKKYES